MQENLFEIFRCPVTRSDLRLQVITYASEGKDSHLVSEGILFANEDWFYPVIKGIPRLLVESFLDYEDFLRKNLPDFDNRQQNLISKYNGLIDYVVKKNKRTKKSFTKEWSIFNYEKDKTWHEETDKLLSRFLREINESEEKLKNKLIFDVGCGNGILNQQIGRSGATVLGMDLSLSIEKANENNKEPKVFFIQGDLQFPPVAFEKFDIVHCSGVLICTNNTELSFSCIEPVVKKGGKLSIWLYHPRKNVIHNFFNFIRRFTSRLPITVQFYLYLVTIFPISYVVKKLKGSKENAREMMIYILDWFSPEYRHEHEYTEAKSWFHKRNYKSIEITTTDTFGFNIIGNRN